MLKFLDIFFIILHTLLILFNLTGWISYRTRRLNLLTLLITGFSWFVLGIFYGVGYCPLTDWHFDVLTKSGISDLPNSYIKYITERLTGLNLKSDIADVFTIIFYSVSLLVSLTLNIRDVRRKPKT